MLAAPHRTNELCDLVLQNHPRWFREDCSRPSERVLEARTTLEDGHVTTRYGGVVLVRTATLIRVP